MNTYDAGIIGYSWAATPHIGAIASTGGWRVTDIRSSRALDADDLRWQHGGPIGVHRELAAMLGDSRTEVVDITG
jgi:hypothetical protein